MKRGFDTKRLLQLGLPALAHAVAATPEEGEEARRVYVDFYNELPIRTLRVRDELNQLAEQLAEQRVPL